MKWLGTLKRLEVPGLNGFTLETYESTNGLFTLLINHNADTQNYKYYYFIIYRQVDDPLSPSLILFKFAVQCSAVQCVTSTCFSLKAEDCGSLHCYFSFTVCTDIHVASQLQPQLVHVSSIWQPKNNAQFLKLTHHRESFFFLFFFFQIYISFSMFFTNLKICIAGNCCYAAAC